MSAAEVPGPRLFALSEDVAGTSTEVRVYAPHGSPPAAGTVRVRRAEVGLFMSRVVASGRHRAGGFHVEAMSAPGNTSTYVYRWMHEVGHIERASCRFIAAPEEEERGIALLDMDLSTIDQAPGHYYVSMRQGRRSALLLGPFGDHFTALLKVDATRRFVVDRYESDPKVVSAAFGTARVPLDAPAPKGVLNPQILERPASVGPRP
jgi:hypothetical protein